MNYSNAKHFVGNGLGQTTAVQSNEWADSPAVRQPEISRELDSLGMEIGDLNEITHRLIEKISPVCDRERKDLNANVEQKQESCHSSVGQSLQGLKNQTREIKYRLSALLNIIEL
jgi:hypothetical protein